MAEPIQIKQISIVSVDMDDFGEPTVCVSMCLNSGVSYLDFHGDCLVFYTGTPDYKTLPVELEADEDY